ncbi:MAG: phosphate/phosphite/phosphonate ABC transporter substrate-binding protein [Chloroflexota bacterium]|nr:phosphate/phosphite/phosphonate ABC transporter substrate-binding protein [Chloroflexota bacterium]
MSSRMYLNAVAVLLVLVTVVITGCSPAVPQSAGAAESGDPHADWPEKFVVGYFSGDDPNEVLERNEPFEAYLEERLGIEVELFTGTSYTAVIEAMRAKRVDAMEVGPFSYILSVEEAGAEALGVGVYSRAENPVYDPDLPSHYYSVIFTKKGSGIETLADLKGKGFNFVDPASTSGHLMPKTFLIKQGLDPDNDMITVFAGSHPTSVISVWNDKADAGATYENNLYRLAEEGQIEFCGFPDGKTGVARTEADLEALYDGCPEGHIVMLALTDPIPSTPFAVRTDLPESFKAAVKEAMLDIKNNPELISQTARWYVDPSKEMGLETLDQYYNPLRDIAKLLDLDLHELK